MRCSVCYVDTTGTYSVFSLQHVLEMAKILAHAYLSCTATLSTPIHVAVHPRQAQCTHVHK
jgi:hypothetical protein